MRVIACDPTGIQEVDRPRYRELLERLRASIRGTEELPDGFVYLVDGAMKSEEVAEWVELEKLCCPFLSFDVGEGRMAIRGPAGAKAILRAEFG
jgi:hypothetical protein